jgi:PTS system ascorbate-specific IIA component
LTLQGILKQYDSIRLNQTAATWEDAIRKSAEPLIEAGAVTPQYCDLMIESTKKLGPYYILSPGMAMPHAQPGDSVVKNAFSFVTLREPAVFPDGSGIKVLACLAAAGGGDGLSGALMQIAEMFSTDRMMEKIYACQDSESVLRLISSINHDI